MGFNVSANVAACLTVESVCLCPRTSQEKPSSTAATSRFCSIETDAYANLLQEQTHHTNEYFQQYLERLIKQPPAHSLSKQEAEVFHKKVHLLSTTENQVVFEENEIMYLQLDVCVLSNSPYAAV